MTLFLQQLINGLGIGFAYALVALGYSLVFGTLKVLNFAHGELLMVSAFIALYIANSHAAFVVILLVGIAAGAAVAVVLERTLIRPVASRSFVAPFATTLGGSMLMVAIAKDVWGTDPKLFPPGVTTRVFVIGSVTITSIQIIIMGVALVGMVVLATLLYRTRLGLDIRATAENAEVAATLGTNTGALASGTLGLAGVLAGTAGVLLCVSFGVLSPFIGGLYGLKGMIAMIVGGLGSLRGAVIAGVAIGIGEVMTVAYISSTWRDAIAFGLLLAVLLVRHAGLFGNRTERYARHT
jgi:branched-chain amino acid transport system permease protein